MDEIKNREMAHQRELKGRKFTHRENKESIYMIWQEEAGRSKTQELNRGKTRGSGNESLVAGLVKPTSSLCCYESNQTTRAPGVWPRPRAGLNWTGCSCPACRG